MRLTGWKHSEDQATGTVCSGLCRHHFQGTQPVPNTRAIGEHRHVDRFYLHFHSGSCSSHGPEGILCPWICKGHETGRPHPDFPQRGMGYHTLQTPHTVGYSCKLKKWWIRGQSGKIITVYTVHPSGAGRFWLVGLMTVPLMSQNNTCVPYILSSPVPLFGLSTPSTAPAPYSLPSPLPSCWIFLSRSRKPHIAGVWRRKYKDGKTGEAEGQQQRGFFVLTVKAAAGMIRVLIPTVGGLDAKMSSVYWTVSPKPSNSNLEFLHIQLL